MRGGLSCWGNEQGFQYSGYKPVFQCIGMGKICRSCRIEIKGRGLGSAPCHVSYEVCLVEKFLLLLCLGVEGGGLCINGWVEGLKVKLWLTPGI